MKKNKKILTILKMISGAGVLIIEMPRSKNDELRLVLFYDKSKKAFLDAGGKCDNMGPIETAIQELFEESAMLLNVPKDLLSGYVEQRVGKRQARYRGYFLLTKNIDRQDYIKNVQKLNELRAPHQFQETDDMVKIPLSQLYETIIVKRENWVEIHKNHWVKLHRRVIDLMRVAFSDGPAWLIHLMEESPYATYVRRKDGNDLIRYDYH